MIIRTGCELEVQSLLIVCVSSHDLAQAYTSLPSHLTTTRFLSFSSNYSFALLYYDKTTQLDRMFRYHYNLTKV